jgi:hypothetical protein
MSRRYTQFSFVVLAMIAIWGIVLPQLARTTTVRERNRWLDEKGIDPAAMFYTDLPMMDRVLTRIER